MLAAGGSRRDCFFGVSVLTDYGAAGTDTACNYEDLKIFFFTESSNQGYGNIS